MIRTSNAPDPLHALQAAARRCARHVAPGCYAARVVILDASGRELLGLTVPAGDDLDTPAQVAAVAPVATPEPEPPVAGWSFDNLRPFYDGKPLEIHGQKLKVLREFVESKEPLSVEALKNRAWKDHRTTDETVRWSIGELRKALRAYFPELEDPIPNGIDGYSLQIR